MKAGAKAEKIALNELLVGDAGAVIGYELQLTRQEVCNANFSNVWEGLL